MDGIEAFAGQELRWAVLTALAPVDETGESLFGDTAENLVDGAWDFIRESFEEHGLVPPERVQLIEAVRAEQRERALDWIYDDFLEGGRLVETGVLTDDQWQAIVETIRAVHVEPPARASVDAMIAQRLRG